MKYYNIEVGGREWHVTVETCQIPDVLGISPGWIPGAEGIGEEDINEWRRLATNYGRLSRFVERQSAQIEKKTKEEEGK